MTGQVVSISGDGRAMQATTALVESLLSEWPAHEAFVAKGVAKRPPEIAAATERVAEMIVRLAGGDPARYVPGYKWMCDMVLEEEYFFRRNKHYRHSSAEEAARLVYSASDVMPLYMDGLLLSQVLWDNHASVLNYYRSRFLGELPGGGRHLEIGPGHGLLLALAAESGRVSYCEGWDISESSLAHTRSCIDTLTVAVPCELRAQNIFDPAVASSSKFDSIVMSEVLEHLERPLDALVALRGLLAPGGRAFFNAPVNSPAIDHIFLFRTPEEVVDVVRRAGFHVDDVHLAPATGYSEARARKLETAISTVVVAR